MHLLKALVQRYGRLAWRQRWVALGMAWAVCVLGWIGVMSIPDQYEASARLYVDADAVLTPLLKGIAIDSVEGGQLDVLQRTLLSRPNLAQLISKTDLELTITGPADEQRLEEVLAREIKVVPQTRNIFTISYRNANPALAYSVVQAVLAIFVESRTGNNRSEIENAQSFLQQQLSSYEGKLQEAEKRRADFRAKYVDLLPGADGGQSRLDVAETNVRTLQGQLQDATARRTMLQKELADTPPTLASDFGPNGALDGDSELVAAERKLKELQQTFTNKHPDVIAARNLVAALRASPHAAAAPAPRPGSAPRGLPNPVYDQLKISLIDSETQVASLERQYGDAVKEQHRLEDVARAAPGLQAEYININRDYDVLRKNYEELLVRREAMRISSAASSGTSKVTVQVVDPPQLPRNPVGPKRLLLVSGVLLAGLGCGGAAAFMIARMDCSFGTAVELGALDLPVIGVLSMLTATPSRARAGPIILAAVALLLLVGVYAGLAIRIMRLTLSA